MIKLLNVSKNKLSNLLDASESEWKSEAESTVNGKVSLLIRKTILYLYLLGYAC